MNNALKLKKIAKEQFAVKNTCCIEEVVSKRCVVDHHKSKRRCFAPTSSVLAGCYDIIVHTAAALLREGIPHAKIHSMFSTIQRMTHIIRTSFGDSDLTYGGNDIGDCENYPKGLTTR